MGSSAAFNIRFYDQKVYFLGDPIQVEVVIANNGTDTLRFKVSDNRSSTWISTSARRRTSVSITRGNLP